MSPIILLVFLSYFSNTCYSSCCRLERESLSSFNLSISIAPPLNWSLLVDCCSWEGVSCDASGKVVNLSLPSRHISGHISPSILNLTNLKTLVLHDNDLTGTIPRDIGQLSSLEELSLHSNHLTGSLPTSLNNCTRLVSLNLMKNSFHGRLSDFNFSPLSKLRSIDVLYNNFTGKLPASLFSCHALSAVRVSFNKLHGEIPREIGELKSLSFFSLSNNRFTNIESAVRILAGCKNLTTLHLKGNFINEELPGSENLIGPDGFRKLEMLSLRGSNLTGQFPLWLSKLSNLQFLALNNNSITGPIPSWLGNLPNLFYLGLADNRLSGHIPVELTKLAMLNNKISSLELPIFFDRSLQYNSMNNLPTALLLSNNNLSGPIPVEIGRMKSLMFLNLSQNDFSGTIPESISNLTKLEKLDLSRNRLSGLIPVSFSNLHFLSEFNVSYNDLEGSIPTGGQWQTFPCSSFEGNSGLHCPNYQSQNKQADEPTQGIETSRNEIINWISFEISYVVFFVITILVMGFR